jgi:hypothetical protein
LEVVLCKTFYKFLEFRKISGIWKILSLEPLTIDSFIEFLGNENKALPNLNLVYNFLYNTSFFISFYTKSTKAELNIGL